MLVIFKNYVMAALEQFTNFIIQLIFCEEIN